MHIYTFNPYMSIICIHLHNSLCMYISICIFFSSFFFSRLKISRSKVNVHVPDLESRGKKKNNGEEKKKKSYVTGVLVCGCDFFVCVWGRVRELGGKRKRWMEKGVCVLFFTLKACYIWVFFFKLTFHLDNFRVWIEFSSCTAAVCTFFQKFILFLFIFYFNPVPQSLTTETELSWHVLKVSNTFRSRPVRYLSLFRNAFDSYKCTGRFLRGPSTTDTQAPCCWDCALS